MKSRIHETHVRMAKHRDGVKGLSIEPGSIKRVWGNVPGQGESKTVVVASVVGGGSCGGRKRETRRERDPTATTIEK